MFLHIIDRQTAKTARLKRYFTGIPCPRGNIAQRYTVSCFCMCTPCTDARYAATKKWKANSKDHLSAYKKQYTKENATKLRKARIIYLKENRDKVRQQRKKHREENRERLNRNNRLWCLNNPEKSKLRKIRYREQNKEKIAEYEQRYRNNNLDIIRKRSREYGKRNKDKVLANCSKRHARKLSATPSWYGELDDFVLREAYRLCYLRMKSTGFKWNVDHMVPLQAKNSCGLHVWNNFQAIPAVMNFSKNNKLIYTQPYEWLHDIPKFFKVIAT